MGQPATTVMLEYDQRGNRTLLNDPNYGPMANVYNAYGEMVEQTNPRAETTNYAYDKLGRITHETGGPDGDITWTYSIAPGRIGTIENVIKNNHRTNYIYDDYLRLASEIEIFDRISYITRYTYDELGRPYTTTHPTGITTWGLNRSSEYGSWLNGKTYMAPFWVGFRQGNNITRSGYSHWLVQDLTQNFTHQQPIIKSANQN